jgi:cell fate (sporulation/competence/biofilm development) regulator YmcA (YheA/YmcA/DUF963 family)
MKMVGIKIIADNQEFTYEEFKKYLEKISDEKELIEIKHDAKVLMKRAAKLLREDKQEPIPFFKEAKEALEDKIESMFQDLKARPYSSPYQTEKQKVIEFLGSLYLPLKSEVCAEVVNKAYPSKGIDENNNTTYWFVQTSDDDDQPEWEIDWAYQNFQLGGQKLNNEQAAEACLKLMQTPLFEGDVTI